MLKQYSSNDVISTLKSIGFEFISQKGSHKKFRKGKLVVIVPAGRKVIPLGTLRSIKRQAGLGKDIFARYLSTLTLSLLRKQESKPLHSPQIAPFFFSQPNLPVPPKLSVHPYLLQPYSLPLLTYRTLFYAFSNFYLHLDKYS